MNLCGKKLNGGKNDIDPLILKSVWEQNKRIRNNWDWENNSSAVVKNKE